MRILLLLEVVVFVLSAVVENGRNYRENIPRFRSVHQPRHEVYLGDEVRLDCQTISKTPTSVEWYRNDKQVTDSNKEYARIVTNNNMMILDIRNIDVSDQGLWSCRVHNTFGQIQRNFTIEVIDFCDYFLIPAISRHRIPMECICLWHYNREAKRMDIDYSAATPDTCNKYATRMITRARKPFANIPCLDDNCKHDIPSFNGLRFPTSLKNRVKNASEPSVTRVTLNSDDVPPHAGSVENAKKTEYINADDDEDEDEDDKYISPDSNLKELNSTKREPPTFNNIDGPAILNETHGLPAGRTIKLGCKADGYPTPKLVWYKNDQLLTKESSRNGGYDYKFKKWSLELEDSVISDTGHFRCEAWNDIGSATKHFNVFIIHRSRTPPIIVPNVLVNVTVNVNDTAEFKCKVISDLIPHIMWVRINLVNGSFHYYNETAAEFMFNYTEMDKIDNAHVHHIGDESFLTLTNVTLDDQGLYACLSGNSLGMTMANASLLVNEFVVYDIPTGDEPLPEGSISIASIILLVLLFMVILIVLLTIVYAILSKTTFKKKGIVDESVGLMSKKKRIIVNKKPLSDDTDGWDSVPSPYQIQIIEEPLTKQEAMIRQQKAKTGNSVLSEYEVDPDPTWEMDRSKLTLVHMLGEGAFGEVWKATYKKSDDPNEGNEMAVAVKKLKISAHEKELIDLVSEMETFKVIGEHENVLRLIGCCTGSGPIYVVLELCRHGNLRDFLRAHRPKEERPNKKSSQEIGDYLEPRKLATRDEIDIIPHLTQRHLVAFAWQVARGMDFMAKKKIIHRDLAARNVLVADNHVLKISDFGLSRDVHCNDYYRKRGNGRLPIKWMALEALDSHVYTIESDVWSFGILLWEIMTLGGTPYPTIAMPELYATLKEGYRMEAPHNCPDEVYNIMVACWQEKRENRPSFGTVVDYLDWMLVQSVNPNAIDIDYHSRRFPELKTSSGPASPTFTRKKRHRPLSMPVSFPSGGPQHSICDDDDDDEMSGDNFKLINPNADTFEKYHFYASPEKKDFLPHPTINTLSDKSKEQLETAAQGYVQPNMLARTTSGVANQSLDSAIGSPAWPSYERTSNNNLHGQNASCLGSTPHYHNINPKVQYTYFNFDKNSINEMARSRDSAIFEEYYSSRQPSNIQYPQIYINTNMTTTKKKTKETIV